MTDPAAGRRPEACYEHRLRVSAADLDEQQHVNNVVYVQWVQDIATAHWHSLVPPECRVDLAWVLLRHEVDYQGAAVLHDALVIATRVGHAKGLTFERFTEIRREDDGRVLAKSRTLWAPVDPRTGRPRRVSPEIRALFSAAIEAEGASEGGAAERG